MIRIKTNNLYYCTLVRIKKVENDKIYLYNDIKYTFVTKEIDEETGKNKYIDFKTKKRLYILNKYFYNNDDYYIIKIDKLCLNNSKVRLDYLEKVIEFLPKIELKIDELYNKTKIKSIN